MKSFAKESIKKLLASRPFSNLDGIPSGPGDLFVFKVLNTSQTSSGVTTKSCHVTVWLCSYYDNILLAMGHFQHFEKLNESEMLVCWQFP